jgi:tRNA A-37 threonylcarbamoyl transferase component Bud32
VRAWKAEVEEICLRALELRGQAREEYLREACREVEVRREVESLLGAADSADSLFAAPAGLFGTPEAVATVDVEERIGPYRLLERLGEGGMGIVYRAEQSAPVRREVAVKIIRPGLDSALVVARFNLERQALALMDHPNIARILEAGTTGADRPYFVMELVRGESITSYCASRGLTVRERVALLIPVCRAIQHAHRNGVIHRDIKPSNILVAEGENGPVPKVIDFGIAKATEVDAAGTFTRAYDVIGTLEYMSPEQAEPTGKGVDIRADVYALGAVLYELLTGSPPLAGLSLRAAGLGTLLKRIQEEVPVAPSRRVAEIAVECDWIALKALEKDRERRYETAGALARDLESFLEGRPVEAGAPSTLYRLSKLARRHRAWVGTAAVFVAVLVGAAAVSSWQALRANRAEVAAVAERDRARNAEQAARMAEQAARAERDRAVAAEADMRRAQELTLAEKLRADQETATARAVASFLQEDLLSQASPNAQANVAGVSNADLKVRTLLERSAAKLETKFADQPAVRASLEHTIAAAYVDLGLYAQAREHALRAVAIRKEALGPRHRLTGASLDRLATAYRGEGKLAEAERIWTELLGHQQRELGERHPDTLQSMHSLAALYRSQGKTVEAVALYERTLALRRVVLGVDHPETLRTSGNLAYAYLFLERAKEGVELQADTLARRRRVLGAEHPDTLLSMSNLGLAYENAKRFAEAQRLLEETLQTQRRVLGEAHSSTLSTVLNLGRVLQGELRMAEAAELLQKAVELARANGQGRSPLALTLINNTGLYWMEAGKPVLAEKVLSEGLAVAREVLGEDHADSLRMELNLANVYRKQGRFERAEPLVLRVIAARSKSSGPEHVATLHARTRLAEVYLDMGRFAEAAEVAARVWEVRRKRSGEADPLTLDSMVQRVRAAMGMGDFGAAREMGSSALELRRKKGGRDGAGALEVLVLLAENAGKSGEWKEAVQRWEECLAAQEAVLGASHATTARTLRELGKALRNAGDGVRANEVEARLATGKR